MSQTEPVVLSYAELNASLASGTIAFEDFPSFSKPVVSSQEKDKTIAVLVKASNLISLDSISKANPLVAVVDSKGKLIDHTGLELSTVDPTFSSALLLLPATYSSSASFTFQVYDVQDLVLTAADHFMGQTVISSEQLQSLVKDRKGEGEISSALSHPSRNAIDKKLKKKQAILSLQPMTYKQYETILFEREEAKKSNIPIPQTPLSPRTKEEKKQFALDADDLAREAVATSSFQFVHENDVKHTTPNAVHNDKNTITFNVNASSLFPLDTAIGKCNPLCALFIASNDGKWTLASHTECINASTEPKFSNALTIPSSLTYESARFELYDCDSGLLTLENLIGFTQLSKTQLQTLVENKDKQTLVLTHNKKTIDKKIQKKNSSITLVPVVSNNLTAVFDDAATTTNTESTKQEEPKKTSENNKKSETSPKSAKAEKSEQKEAVSADRAPEETPAATAAAAAATTTAAAVTAVAAPASEEKPADATPVADAKTTEQEQPVAATPVAAVGKSQSEEKELDPNDPTVQQTPWGLRRVTSAGEGHSRSSSVVDKPAPTPVLAPVPKGASETALKKEVLQLILTRRAASATTGVDYFPYRNKETGQFFELILEGHNLKNVGAWYPLCAVYEKTYDEVDGDGWLLIDHTEKLKEVGVTGLATFKKSVLFGRFDETQQKKPLRQDVKFNIYNLGSGEMVQKDDLIASAIIPAQELLQAIAQQGKYVDVPLISSNKLTDQRLKRQNAVLRVTLGDLDGTRLNEAKSASSSTSSTPASSPTNNEKEKENVITVPTHIKDKSSISVSAVEASPESAPSASASASASDETPKDTTTPAGGAVTAPSESGKEATTDGVSTEATTSSSASSSSSSSATAEAAAALETSPAPTPSAAGGDDNDDDDDDDGNDDAAPADGAANANNNGNNAGGGNKKKKKKNKKKNKKK